MSENSVTRRTLLRSGAAASGMVAAGALAGCSEDTAGNGTDDGNGDGNGNGSGNTADPSVVVPAKAEMVATIEVSGLVEDQNIRSIGNAFIEQLSQMEGYEGPSNIEEAFSSAESQAGLDPNSLHSMTVFGQVTQTSSEQYGGMVMATSLSESDMTDAMDRAEAEYEKSTYGGKTLYSVSESEVSGGSGGMVSQGGSMAVLGNGRFAVGTDAVVKDVVDVVNGDSDAISGDLEGYYSGTREGYVRFASLVPESSGDSGGSGGMPGMSAVEHASGAFYSAGSSLGIEATLHAGSEQAASQLSTALQTQLDAMTEQSGGGDQQNPMVEVASAISITQSGSDVNVAYEESTSNLESYAQMLVQMLLGGMGTTNFTLAP